MDGIIRYTAEDALTQQGLQTLEGPGLWIRAADFDEHQVQVKQREVALQQRLTTADQRIDELTQHPNEPVALTAVATLRDDGDGGLEPEWLLEGGTAELFEGAVLLIADTDQTLCEEDGHCEMYRQSAFAESR